MVMPALLLQRPHRTSKTRDHRACLERRLPLWEAGDFHSLLQEGRCIQQKLRRLSFHHSPDDESNLTRRFTNFMQAGKTKDAVRLLSDQEKGGVLHLSDPVETTDAARRTVRDILVSKHPPGQPAHPDALIHDEDMGDPIQTHPVLFDCIDAAAIRSTALHTFGAAGPSGLDARNWRRLCTSFNMASNNLCQSLSSLAIRLCTVLVDPQGLAPFTACRLIALDKNPGVRPIGICETVRRLISKAILRVIRDDVQQATGAVQLCAGQTAGIEAAILATRLSFSSAATEGVLLVDASNAFNSLNRKVALLNIQTLCPPIATVLFNTYRDSSQLFVDGTTLYSQEGTTQGDPLAMPMYALATLPLIRKLSALDLPTSQLWYADDATAFGYISHLREWWDKLVSCGPSYGYYPNAFKTWLITKEAHLQEAATLFQGTGVHITAQGRPLLGAAIGTPSYINQYVTDKVNQWAFELERLSVIAKTQPHAAHAALTHSLSSKWTFITRTIPSIGDLLQPLEDILRQKLIPALTGRSAPSDVERQLLALPARLGGIGVTNPTVRGNVEYNASQQMCRPLVDHILHGHSTYPSAIANEQMAAKAMNNRCRRQQQNEVALNLHCSLPPTLQRAMTLAQEKGASSWLTILPINEFCFTLHKSAFRDALALRYGWQPLNVPSTCSCGKSFTIDHVLSCAKGGFPSIRHNEIRDVTATLLSEVCHDVGTEPHLQPIDGEAFPLRSANVEDGARLDIVASGFWGGRFERTYYDVRVFNPHAPSNQHPQQQSVYRRHEMLKRNAYEQRVREVEHASFTPLVMSLTGGLGPAATTTYKRLASLLSTKCNQSYGSVMAWLRCRLSFSLLRSAIMCIRGARFTQRHEQKFLSTTIDVISSEALVAY